MKVDIEYYLKTKQYNENDGTKRYKNVETAEGDNGKLIIELENGKVVSEFMGAIRTWKIQNG